MEQNLDFLRVCLPCGERELELRNPVLTASGTFGYGLEFMPYGNLTELGGIVVKGLSLEPRKGNPMPRIAETACGMLNSIGLQNCGVEAFLRDKLPLLPWAELPVIANLYAETLDDFKTLAERLSGEPGIAALEANISCPNVRKGGLAFGLDPAEAAKVTKAVKDGAGRLPVMVKLSPNAPDIAAVAKSCEDAGADLLSCINTLSGMAVDIHSKKPLLGNLIGGLSGPAIKPVALRCVWQATRAVKIPVIGIGGILRAQDILEFILVGAHAVQVGTANFRSPDASFKLVKDLAQLMQRLGINNLAEYRGSLIV